ncbi:hypothetical protein EV13_2846 [Prochlorococcus sp. MIT 0702]|nr:hypothetical protein EV12_2794 [Prochlorococcus sp. MIT 0701]KGG26069.1 hypothetical protein EV13_2846 [Prochlorococcus sp. MIT 0702]KGG30755.1 hypothetical protein EV14_2690 [Prochlorococcus sp. MIT 0703]
MEVVALGFVQVEADTTAGSMAFRRVDTRIAVCHSSLHGGFRLSGGDV